MSGQEIGSEKLRWYQGLTRYHYLVLVVAICGWMFDTMDQWLYVLVKGPALRSLLEAANSGPVSDGLVTEYTGIAQMWLVIGWATGGLFFGMVGDKWGRTRTMAITILIYACFTGLSGLSKSWLDFTIYRFLTGLGVGGEFAAGASLIAETFPAHARPMALGIMQAFSALGNMMAAAINYYMVSNVDLNYAWRWVFFVGLFPALLVFVIFMFIREPEKWQEARAHARSGKEQLGSIFDLFTGPYAGRAVIGILLAAVGVVGFWGIGTWSPELLRNAIKEGINPETLGEASTKIMVEQKASIAIGTQNFGAFFGILAWTFLAIWFGRRTAFALSFLTCLIVVPGTFLLTHTFTHALILYPIMGFVTTSLFGGYAVYFPELFPTRLRATGTGVCYNVARYIAASGPYTFGLLTAVPAVKALAGGDGVRGAAVVLSSIFLLGLAVLPFAPETKGKPLPE
ncbi:MAG: MFS transporter [Candidatus Hydrogenedentes bacterium]|nr:MFS transporter [Candidatus Hydrogenedentota bacterium]